MTRHPVDPSSRAQRADWRDYATGYHAGQAAARAGQAHRRARRAGCAYALIVTALLAVCVLAALGRWSW